MVTGSGISRRRLAAGLALAVGPRAATAQPAPSEAAIQKVQSALKNAKGTSLVMLGTAGGPGPRSNRHQTSHVMLSDGAAYVLDCGLGVTGQLARTGIPFSALRSIFITHHHPDHNAEYGPLLLIGWTQGMRLEVKAFGPPPLKQMTEDFLRAYRTTIGFWAEDLKVKPLETIEVGEVSAAGPVMQDGLVKVSAIVVEHPPVTPSLGYRFDFKDRSIAFSGDTVPLEAVATMARGADVLVHEAMYPPAIEPEIKARLAQGMPGTLADFMAHMRADHTPAEDAGRIAQEAGVGTLVLSHLVPADATVSDETWRAAAAKHFKGEIVVAQDLTVI